MKEVDWTVFEKVSNNIAQGKCVMEAFYLSELQPEQFVDYFATNRAFYTASPDGDTTKIPSILLPVSLQTSIFMALGKCQHWKRSGDKYSTRRFYSYLSSFVDAVVQESLGHKIQDLAAKRAVYVA